MRDLVVDSVRVGPHILSLLRPAAPDDLIDESRFETDEFMPYWAELWPSGLALAEVLAEHELRGARVVELGCGLGVPSIVAALGGARVLAADWAPAALALLHANAQRNGAAVETLEVDWADAGALVARAPFDLVVCADVLYEPRNVDALVDLLPLLGDHVLLGEPGRQTAGAFFARAEAGWEITRVGNINRLRRR